MVSFSNILTLYHIGGMTGKSDWSAIVETAPGIAVAEVRNTKFRRLRDEVCQSRTKTYEAPYGISPVVATTDELNHALRSAGDHYF